jgi:ATP-dependent helicase/nuclease subunit B
MPIRRIFLNWDRPVLPKLVDDLLQRSRSTTHIDLSHLILVFSGRQAERRCLEILTERAGGALCPPMTATVGRLPELLYLPKRPFASTLVQQMVWAQALQKTPESKLRRLMQSIPDPEDQAAWLRLGDLLRRQHAELAGDQLDFAEVWKRGTTLPGFSESERWKLLAAIQTDYWRLLDALELWDQQTARLEAIRRKECQTDHDIVTVGTVDLNRTTRAMLEQVADRVTAYVPAPESMADHFDEFGCLLPDRWADEKIDLRSDQILMADDSKGQCSQVVAVLASLNGEYSFDDISIGVPDPQLVIPLQRTLAEYDVPSHWPIDRMLSATGPFRLLETVADFLENHSSSQFAALIRHPDVGEWLNTRGLNENWLSEWDEYFVQHLPPSLDDFPEGKGADVAWKLKREIQTLLSPFLNQKKPLLEWGTAVNSLLMTVYGDRTFRSSHPEERVVVEACQELQRVFAVEAELPESLDLPVSATDAIRLLLSNADCELYRGFDGPAIRMTGWLELPLDDAPVVIVTTMNETFVPQSVNHDLFLPNQLRAHLGIEDNARRYARDLYLLSSLVSSRKVLRLIVARRDVSRNPLAPSRLLFATDPEQIAQRVLEFYDESNKDSTEKAPLPVPPSTRQLAGQAAFPIPRPGPLKKPHTEFRVTEFRDYLASPYRYYLRHILGLSEISDEVTELDGAAFGTLVHDVLSRFGSSAAKDSRDPSNIAEFLDQSLSEVVRELYGEDPLAAILIQKEQARRRLNAFAEWQAEWRREGWQIHAVEHKIEDPVPFDLGDGRSIFLKGRLDRIDVHPSTGDWTIFDYKTGDAGLSPDKTHRYKEDWIDLQLPLYRYLASPICHGGTIGLGYIILPRDVNAVSAQFAQWSEEELLHADDTARQIARRILDEDFWELLEAPPATMTEFDTICQSHVFGQEVWL